MRERRKFLTGTKLYLIWLSSISAMFAGDVQRQFTVLMENAHESCHGVIAMCERPFIGFDIKPRVQIIVLSFVAVKGSFDSLLDKRLPNKLHKVVCE